MTEPGGARRFARWTVPALLLGVVVVQASLVRTVWHPAAHSGGDNAAYVALADALLEGEGYVEGWDPARPAHTRYPPVFPALLAMRIAAGGLSWGELKAVPGAFAVLLAAAVFLWGTARRGPFWGAGLAVLTGLATSVLDHSRWVLSDVPFVAFTVLALWAIDRAEPPPDRAGSDGDAGPDRPGSVPWALAALLLTGLAYFTRSAGLPLVVALLGALALRRRWRVLLLGGGTLLAAVAAWTVRTRITPSPAGVYGSEMWMLNPYRPELGSAGPADLVARVVGNAGTYLWTHGPLGLVGSASGGARLVAVAVAVAAVAGWALRARRGIGALELFAPLYVGLILIWPEVWSGDRFWLPLVPVTLLYAGEAVKEGVGRVAPAAVAGALLAAGAVVAFAQTGGVARLTDEAAVCRAVSARGGPYACAGAPVMEFAQAARWAGANLPLDAVVLTRKPRIWYALSGRPSRTYPFVADPDSLFEAAERAGARWVVLDGIGTQGIEFLGGAIRAAPGAFCAVAGFGGGEGRLRTELLGLVPEGRGVPAADGAVTIDACPADLAGAERAIGPYASSSPVPILELPFEP